MEADIQASARLECLARTSANRWLGYTRFTEFHVLLAKVPRLYASVWKRSVLENLNMDTWTVTPIRQGKANCICIYYTFKNKVIQVFNQY